MTIAVDSNVLVYALDRAGGDKHGERSATIYIVDKEEYPLWDIRVDAHPAPFAELRRLHDIDVRSTDFLVSATVFFDMGES